jgi:hypothetical protein
MSIAFMRRLPILALPYGAACLAWSLAHGFTDAVFLQLQTAHLVRTDNTTDPI